MTVRLLLDDRQRERSVPVGRRRWLWLEYLLLFVGLTAVDYYIWVSADTMIGQAYDNWSLDEQVKGRHPSFRGFAAEKLRLPWLAEPAEQITPADTPKTEAKTEHQKVPLAPFALVGRIEVPRLGLTAMAREGVDEETLRRAVGHVPSTALPGEKGNAAFAAHRDTLFRKLRDIRKDDKISVETPDRTYEYVVESLKIVKPSDVEVLEGPKDQQLLTLITCYPFNYIGSAPNRFIVRARLLDAEAAKTPLLSPPKSVASATTSPRKSVRRSASKPTRVHSAPYVPPYLQTSDSGPAPQQRKAHKFGFVRAFWRVAANR